MVSRKAMANGAHELPQAPRVATSRLPSMLQFPLVVLISFSASFILFSAGSQVTNFELSKVSRSVNDVGGVLAVPARRMVELAVGWYMRYDDYDMASLMTITHLPYYYFLTTFYGISLRTSSLYLVLDVLSATLPFYLLRRRLPAHAPRAKTAVQNKVIITDWVILLYTSTLGALVYSFFVYTSYLTWLPVHLVTYFDGIHSLEGAHNVQLPPLVLTLFPLGWAARTFLFSPSTAAQTSLADARKGAFNPATATLGSTVERNVWGWSKGTKVVIQRTATLAALAGLMTWIRVWKTLEGSDGVGAFGWASIFVAASMVNGAVMRWVGHV